jgi:hypothetical protein
MKNTLVMGLMGLFLCSFAEVDEAFADVVTLPLNCAGDYNVNTPRWTTNFDLGVTFSEISHVYIDWSGEINADLYPGNPDPIPYYGIMEADISTLSPLAFATVFGGVSTYPNPEPFDARSEFVLWDVHYTWNDFFDGKGTITILVPSIAGDPPPIYRGSAVIDNATLVIEGTIIPEPSTLVLIGLGFTQVLGLKRNNRKN